MCKISNLDFKIFKISSKETLRSLYFSLNIFLLHHSSRLINPVLVENKFKISESLSYKIQVAADP